MKIDERLVPRWRIILAYVTAVVLGLVTTFITAATPTFFLESCTTYPAPTGLRYAAVPTLLAVLLGLGVAALAALPGRSIRPSVYGVIHGPVCFVITSGGSLFVAIHGAFGSVTPGLICFAPW